MKTIINARVDKNLKKALEVMAEEMGISLSSLISATLTKLAKKRKIELSSQTKNQFSTKYEEAVLNNPEFAKTVSVAKSPKEIDTFFESL